MSAMTETGASIAVDILDDYLNRLIHAHGVIGAGKVEGCDKCERIRRVEALLGAARSGTPVCHTCGWPIPCKCGPT